MLSVEEFITLAQREQVERAIVAAEMLTSGEIRVHLDQHIEEDVMDHAAFIFEALDMHRTRDRNGVLIYIVVGDRNMAVLGDVAIDKAVPHGFWDEVYHLLRTRFAAGEQVDGLCEAVTLVGQKLQQFFPLLPSDTNELPNTITVGKPNISSSTKP
ncbi:MAG: TPM domain-containing protein [Flavobacteriales bacterium]|nr:TPM domain-containing protein [Flavobacteriales bacterium]MBK6945052.1 TPM domain-containing protein [Flavobacteriales bacterium]MBK7239401.1 TPM domain-containing protein [Flavobacteriales bacterium]MBK7295932.1 TPM domain-containing protein [Flavobacteriales bacterium]MBK9535393.1 TPM domain-containing protein [Flavobacteriales bacterium]